MFTCTVSIPSSTQATVLLPTETHELLTELNKKVKKDDPRHNQIQDALKRSTECIEKEQRIRLGRFTNFSSDKLLELSQKTWAEYYTKTIAPLIPQQVPYFQAEKKVQKKIAEDDGELSDDEEKWDRLESVDW